MRTRRNTANRMEAITVARRDFPDLGVGAAVFHRTFLESGTIRYFYLERAGVVIADCGPGKRWKLSELERLSPKWTLGAANDSTAGFGLIELMVVILIIGVLGSVAIATYSKWINSVVETTEAMPMLRAMLDGEKASQQLYETQMVAAAQVGVSVGKGADGKPYDSCYDRGFIASTRPGNRKMAVEIPDQYKPGCGAIHFSHDAPTYCAYGNWTSWGNVGGKDWDPAKAKPYAYINTAICDPDGDRKLTMILQLVQRGPGGELYVSHTRKREGVQWGLGSVAQEVRDVWRLIGYGGV